MQSSPLLSLALLLLHLPHAATALNEFRTCPSSNIPPPPHSPQPSAMRLLLNDLPTYKTFFSTHFQRTHLHISHSNRLNRPRWMRMYRTLLGNKRIETLLSHNVSAKHPGTLRLHHDITLQKPSEIYPNICTMKHLSHIPRTASTSKYIHLSDLHSLFKNSFTISLLHMSYRTRNIATFTSSLRTFWRVPTTATLNFAPQTPPTITHPCPVILPSHTFLVLLDGTHNVTIYPHLFPHPFPQHVHAESVLRAAHNRLPQPIRITLHEGDVLYLPAGHGIDVRTITPISLYITFDVHTHFSTVLHAVRALLPRGQPTKKGLLRLAADVAAEFTPQLREFLPAHGGASRAMGVHVAHGVREHAVRFLAAAEKALFDAVLGVVSGGEGEVAKWARALGKRERRRAEGRFVEDVMEVDVGIHAVRRVVMDMKVGKEGGWKEFCTRELALKRHGFGLRNGSREAWFFHTRCGW